MAESEQGRSIDGVRLGPNVISSSPTYNLDEKEQEEAE